MPDVETVCVQCKETFLFTEKEQEVFYQRNLMPPQRCAKCRSKRLPRARMHPKNSRSFVTIAESTTRFLSNQRSDALYFAENVTRQAVHVPALLEHTIS
jgi:hypothetical protein